MEAMTVSEVSKNFGVFTRMLRYYEQIGLIESFRQESYAYRMYRRIAENSGYSDSPFDYAGLLGSG